MHNMRGGEAEMHSMLIKIFSNVGRNHVLK